jgi:hypothetical protein
MRFNLLLAIGVASLGYFLWALHVAGRYESLCQLSYWEATSEELRACEEHQAELPTK